MFQFVTTVLDSEILNDGGGAILQALDSMVVQYEVKSLPFKSCIGWMRDKVEYSADENGKVCYTIKLVLAYERFLN